MRILSLIGLVACLACSSSRTPPVAHVIVVIQENHTFDNYFGQWCTAAIGSNPTCSSGPSCCEAAPTKDPAGVAASVLDDTATANFDPNHTQVCELSEIDDGGMDGYSTQDAGPGGYLECPGNGGCCNPQNFALASGDPSTSVIGPYLGYAQQYAINDHYFQSVAGQSSSNDMYLATTKFVFLDNTAIPNTAGYQCTTSVNLDPDAGTTPGYATPTSFPGTPNIGSLLLDAGHTFAFYAEGYNIMADVGYRCPMGPSDCPPAVSVAPCLYSPGDDPFAFFPDVVSNAENPLRDFSQLQTDLAGATLPEVSYVKAIGYKTEHPGNGLTLSQGVAFVTALVNAVEASSYAKNTLILVTWDESGGYYDHVKPPPVNAIDNEPYGPRIPVIAVGPLARPATIDHTQLEHSSIVKFIEWDFLGGTGQLNGRDTTANNIGGLLQPSLDVPTN